MRKIPNILIVGSGHDGTTNLLSEMQKFERFKAEIISMNITKYPDEVAMALIDKTVEVNLANGKNFTPSELLRYYFDSDISMPDKLELQSLIIKIGEEKEDVRTRKEYKLTSIPTLQDDKPTNQKWYNQLNNKHRKK